MPFRLNEYRAKIQFIAPSTWPMRIYRAATATDTVSNTRYIQEALAARLSKDLGIPLEDLLAELPTPRGSAGYRILPNGRGVPIPSRTNEEVN